MRPTELLALPWRSIADAIDPAGSAASIAVKAYAKGYADAQDADEARKREIIDQMYAPINAAARSPSPSANHTGPTPPSATAAPNCTIVQLPIPRRGLR